MRSLSWKFWELFVRKNRSTSRVRRHSRSVCPPEALESRSLLTATASGTISGVAFIDGDDDGVKDSNEKAVPGVTVTLTGTSSGGIAVNVSTTTKADGTYSFQNVLAGTNYSLATGTATGLSGTQTFSLTGIEVAGGQTVTQNLAYEHGIALQFLSIRQFTTQTAASDFPFGTAGTTNGLAAARENNLPTQLNGTSTSLTAAVNSPNDIIDLAGVFTDPDMTNSQVKIKTAVGTTTGDINVELFDTQAPKTVANFFNYVTDNRYDDTFFHRLVNGFVIQGGGFAFDDDTNSLSNVETDDPVENEFSATRSNIKGTLAMAKLGGDPDSATSQFFINLGDNSGNLDTQNGGFTVFGKLVAAADQTVVDTLAATTVRDQSVTNGALGEVPLSNFAGTNDDPNFLSTVAASNFVRITDVEVVKRDEFLAYSVISTDNPLVVSASIENNRMTLDYGANQSGVANIVVRATDKFGATLDVTYQITVGSGT